MINEHSQRSYKTIEDIPTDSDSDDDDADEEFDEDDIVYDDESR